MPNLQDKITLCVHKPTHCIFCAYLVFVNELIFISRFFIIQHVQTQPVVTNASSTTSNPSVVPSTIGVILPLHGHGAMAEEWSFVSTSGCLVVGSGGS